MIAQAPFLVVGIPLFTALIMGVFGLIYPSIVRLIGCIGITLATISSVVLFNEVSTNGIQEYFFGNWPAPIGIAYSVDHLNALMILLIYVVAFFAFIYSLKSVPPPAKLTLNGVLVIIMFNVRYIKFFNL